MNRQKGFTLIEMLVVIAVIGILSATALTALGPARNKAKDARIISGLNQVRAIAETLYVTNYADVTLVQTDIAKTAIDISANGGALVITRIANDVGYDAYSKLNAGKFYCVDSDGFAGVIAAEASAADGTCQ